MPRDTAGHPGGRFSGQARAEAKDVRWPHAAAVVASRPPSALTAAHACSHVQVSLHSAEHSAARMLRAGEQLRKTHSRAERGVCCILAAGNHMFPAVRDVLQQLVVNNNLCVLKINPCNDWIGPAMATILKPLIDAGAVRIVYGGAATAKV